MEPPAGEIGPGETLTLAVHARLAPLVKGKHRTKTVRCRIIGLDTAGRRHHWIISTPVRFPYRLSTSRLNWGSIDPDERRPLSVELETFTALRSLQLKVQGPFRAIDVPVGPLAKADRVQLTFSPHPEAQRGEIRGTARITAVTVSGQRCWFELKLGAFVRGYTEVTPTTVLLGTVAPGDAFELSVWERAGRALRAVTVRSDVLPVSLRQVRRLRPDLWVLELGLQHTEPGAVRGLLVVDVRTAGGQHDAWPVSVLGYMRDARATQQAKKP